jgi:iron complex outermembrane receptor protein
MIARSVALIAGWSVGGGRLTATLAYNESHNRIDQDGDGTAIPFTETIFHNDADQRYGELLYASDADRPFSFVVGSNYYDEHFVQNNQIPTLGYPLYQAGGVIDTASYAAFAHAQYALRPSTRVFGGLRYSHDTKDMREYLNYRAFFGLPTTNADKKSWSKITYEVGVSHDFSPSVTGYAKYATGYKSGGYSVSAFNPPFDPENNRNLEVGLKGAFLDRALQANLAAFHMKYRDLQVNQVQGLISAVSNAGRATVDGVEVESVLRPTETLRIEASAAWLDARFDAFMTQDSSRPALGALNLAGHTLPGAPHYTASLGVFNDVPTDLGTVSLGARVDWKSRIYFSEFNIPISSQKAVAKLDLFMNFKSRDERWTASLFALNATDEQVRANVVVVSDLLGSLGVAQYQPGRQVGVSVGYHF